MPVPATGCSATSAAIRADAESSASDQHTGGVPDEGTEPDDRMSLAAERTYLAYVRTSLALLAGGVAVVGALPDAGYLGLRRVIGLVLVLAGLVVGGTARQRWRAVDAAMRRGEPFRRRGWQCWCCSSSGITSPGHIRDEGCVERSN